MPAPPPGFVLDSDTAPPQGFVLDGQPVVPPAANAPEPSPLLQDPFATEATPGFEGGADVPLLTEKIPVQPNPQPPSMQQLMDNPSLFQDFQREAVQNLSQAKIIRAENSRRRMKELELRFEKIGESFNPDQHLGGDFDNLVLRADLMRSDKPSEVKMKVMNTFGRFGGEFKVIKLDSGDQVAVFKPSQEAEWRLVDPEGFDTFSAFADVAGAVVDETSAAELMAAMLTGGSTLAGRIIAQSVAATVGEFTKSQVESMRGVEDSTAMETMFNATVAAFGAGLGEKLFNFRKTLKEEDVGDFVPQMQEFLRSEGIPELMIGQVSANPLVRAMFQQSRSSTKKGADVIRDQIQGLSASLQRRADEVETLTTGAIDRASQEALDRAADQTVNKVLKDGFRGTNLDEVTEKVIVNWSDRQRASIGAKYDAALAVGSNVGFNLGLKGEGGEESAKGLAGRFLAGVRGRAEDGEDVAIDPVEGEFRKALTTLSNLADRQVGDIADNTAFEAMKRLRTRFWTLSQPDAGREGRNQFQNEALQIYQALSRTLDNPTGAQSNEFRGIWNDARKANREYEANLENLFVRQMIANSTVPGSDFAVNASRQLFTPDNPNLTRLVIDLATTQERRILGDGLVTSLMREPAKIRTALSQMKTLRDQSNLRAVLPADIESALTAYGKAAERLGATGVQRALTKGDQGVEAFKNIFASSNRAQLNDLVGGNFDSEMANGLRAGFYADMLNKVVNIDKDGTRTISNNVVAKHVAKAIQEKKIFTFMSPAEIRNLENFGIAAAIFSGKMDAGGAIRRGAIVGGIRQVGRPTRVFGAAHALATDRMTLAILASPAGRKLMRSPDLKNLSPGTAQAIRIAGVLTTSAITRAINAEAGRNAPPPRPRPALQEASLEAR